MGRIQVDTCLVPPPETGTVEYTNSNAIPIALLQILLLGGPSVVANQRDS